MRVNNASHNPRRKKAFAGRHGNVAAVKRKNKKQEERATIQTGWLRDSVLPYWESWKCKKGMT